MLAAFAWTIPEGLSLNEAAGVSIEFGTADDCLFEFGHLKAGETVLIQAGASGVDLAAIQLAKAAGATVLAFTNGAGVNLVVDSVGGSTLEGSIASLAYRGRISWIGRAGREERPPITYIPYDRQSSNTHRQERTHRRY